MRKKVFLFAGVAMLLIPLLVLAGCGDDFSDFESGLLKSGDEKDVTPQQPADKHLPPLVSVFDSDDRASGNSFDDNEVDSAEVLTAVVWMEKLQNGNMRVATSLPAQQKTHILARITHWAHEEDEGPFLAPFTIITIKKNASFSGEFLPPEPEHWTRAIRVQIEPFTSLRKLPLAAVNYKTAEGYDLEEGHEFTAPYRAPEDHRFVDFFHFPE